MGNLPWTTLVTVVTPDIVISLVPTLTTRAITGSPVLDTPVSPYSTKSFILMTSPVPGNKVLGLLTVLMLLLRAGLKVTIPTLKLVS